ncbi:MAG: NHLP bacteriocin system secretion protein [Candidatus Muiribacteriota bacterium]
MSQYLFRKAALDRLSSPEQLDKTLTIVSLKGWIILAASALIIVSLLFWSFFGKIPYRITGTGMLIKTGGIYDISHISEGKVTDVRIRVNDIISKGDVIGRIEQLELLEELKTTRQKLADFKQDLKNLEALKTEKEAIQIVLIEQEINALNQSIKNLHDRVAFLKDKIDREKILVKERVITRQQVALTENELKSAYEEIARNENLIKQKELSKIENEKLRIEEISRVNNEIKNMEKRIIELQDMFNDRTRIVSPYDGRVIEVLTTENDIISAGQSLVRIELIGKQIKELETVVYIPVTLGKKIKPGMKVEISPSTVKKEEFGYILGRVSSVSEYPVTKNAMMKTLGNEILINTIAQDGAPIEVFADLHTDSETVSGFKWSSKSGPPSKIYSGTLCDVNITVSEIRPINFIIPEIRKRLGI